MSERIDWKSMGLVVLLGLSAGAQGQGQGSGMAVAAPSESAVAPAAPAGPTLTMEELLQRVIAHNPGLQAAMRQREQAEAGVNTAQAIANPRLEYNQGQNEARVPSAVPGQVRGWALAQFIENPFARSARVEAARAAERGSREQVAVVRNELAAQVQLRAYEHLLRREEARSLAADLALLEQVRERVRLRVESGEAARYEIIKADAEIINARQRQQTASLQADQALLALNRLAAGQLPAQWTLEGELDAETALGELDEIQALARLNNPEIKALRSLLDRASQQAEGARSSRWPGLEVRYAETTAADTRQQLVGVQMQIPLFDQRRGPIAEADAERERLRVQLEGRQAELEQQVLQAWKSLEMARLRVEALAQGVMREAEAALRVAQAAYRYGERGILDVLDAQRVLQSVRSDLLDARYQQQAARIEIELLIGRHAGERL